MQSLIYWRGCKQGPDRNSYFHTQIVSRRSISNLCSHQFVYKSSRGKSFCAVTLWKRWFLLFMWMKSDLQMINTTTGKSAMQHSGQIVKVCIQQSQQTCCSFTAFFSWLSAEKCFLWKLVVFQIRISDSLVFLILAHYPKLSICF